MWRRYLEAGGLALSEIAGHRNRVLHSRPATGEDGGQTLYRWRPSEGLEADDFGFIRREYLRTLLDRIAELESNLLQLRPPLRERRANGY